MRGRPGSQTRELMQEKEVLARRLLAHGLSITQVSQQLRCSRNWVRSIAKGERDATEYQVVGAQASRATAPLAVPRELEGAER